MIIIRPALLFSRSIVPLLVYCPSPVAIHKQLAIESSYAHYEYKCSVSEQVSNNEPVGVNFIHTVNCNNI